MALLFLMDLAVFLGLLFIGSSQIEANPDAKRLYDDLLSNYNRLIRPVANNTDKITVRMGLKLSQLVDLVRTVQFMFDVENAESLEARLLIQSLGKYCILF
jgi:hypothetical protein